MRTEPTKDTSNQKFEPYVDQMVHNLQQAHQKCHEYGENRHEPHEAECLANDRENRVINRLG